MSVAIVDRLARVLERKLDRRGFLARTALGGAALSVAPVDFTLRPLDAYAAICLCNGFNCDCGAACCDAMVLEIRWRRSEAQPPHCGL